MPRPQNSERILSSTNNWKNNLCTCKILKLDPYFSPYAKKMNWEWIKDLNRISKIIKLLVDKIGGKLLTLNLTMIFFVYDTKSIGNRNKKIYKWTTSNLK